MIALIKRMARWPWFVKPAKRDYGNPTDWVWVNPAFAIPPIPLTKNERLAQIARERDALKDDLSKAMKQKKARAPIYAKLRALSIEELNVVTGR